MQWVKESANSLYANTIFGRYRIEKDLVLGGDRYYLYLPANATSYAYSTLDEVKSLANTDYVGQLAKYNLYPAETVAILKGVGKKNGDGFKDTTTVGEIVFVWNKKLQEPYEMGQYPRVGKEHWSASTDQYDFYPASLEEVQTLFADLNKKRIDELLETNNRYLQAYRDLKKIILDLVLFNSTLAEVTRLVRLNKLPSINSPLVKDKDQ